MADAARDLLLEEYQAAQDTYLHYDSFRWQAGSFLTAGVFLFWGLLITQIELPARVAATGATLVTLLMPVGSSFAHQYHHLYLCKLARIREIEETLDFEQHRRFVGSGVNGIRYKTFGPKGHNLDLFVYALTSITGTVLGFAQGQASLWLLLQSRSSCLSVPTCSEMSVVYTRSSHTSLPPGGIRRLLVTSEMTLAVTTSRRRRRLVVTIISTPCMPCSFGLISYQPSLGHDEGYKGERNDRLSSKLPQTKYL